MGSGVVTVGRRKYAVGLYWENSPSSRVVAAAKEAASQPGQKANFFAVRRAADRDGRVPQFGLGQISAGHKSGMPSFAGCLANEQGGSWIGGFRLREGTVVTIVRDDLIVPDGDQLFLDENEARERLLQEISFGGLQRIFAPESWAIPGADSMPLSLLIDERRDVVLRPVSVPKYIWLLGGCLLLLLLCGLGFGLYMQNEAAKEAALEAERMNALARARAAANQLAFGNGDQPHYPPPERFWEEKPPIMDVVEACHKGMAQIPAGVAGWHLEELKCDGNSMSLSWKRLSGNSSPPMNWTINETGAQATSSVILPKLSPRGHEDLINPSDIIRRYLAQNWMGTIARMADDPPPPPPPGYKGKWNPPPTPWVKRSFTLSVPELPSVLPSYFQDLPGIFVTGMTFHPASNSVGGSWSVEGVIYANRV